MMEVSQTYKNFIGYNFVRNLMQLSHRWSLHLIKHQIIIHFGRQLVNDVMSWAIFSHIIFP